MKPQKAKKPMKPLKPKEVVASAAPALSSMRDVMAKNVKDNRYCADEGMQKADLPLAYSYLNGLDDKHFPMGYREIGDAYDGKAGGNNGKTWPQLTAPRDDWRYSDAEYEQFKADQALKEKLENESE